MNNIEYHEILTKLGETMNMLEDFETALISKFGERCHSAVWIRLTSCYVVLTSLKFSEEYESLADEQGGWSMTD